MKIEGTPFAFWSNILYTTSMKGMWKVCNAPEFDEWFLEQTNKHKQQIRDRISRLQVGHFGNFKSVSTDGAVWELKWENGRRIYYSYIEELKILLLTGGNKNGQAKDIAKARKIYQKYQQA